MFPKLSPLSFGFAARVAAVYGGLFMWGGIQLPYFPLWLKAKGLDAREIGIVLAAPMVVRLFAIPAAARIAERTGALRGMISIALAVATVGYVAVGLANGFLAILVLFALASFAVSPASPLTDTYALHGLGQRNRAYGPVRLWGSVAFVVGTFLAGYAVDAFPAHDLIWLMVAASLLSAVAAFALEPMNFAPHAPSLGQSRRLLTNPAFLAVTAASGLIQGSHAVYYGFSALDWSKAGLDGTTIAMLWALGVFAEIALFAAQGRLPLSITPVLLLAVGGAGAALRWLVMAFDPPPAALPALQLLHGLSFGATHLGAMALLVKIAPQGRSASAQGFYAIGLGAIMAAMMSLSGWLYATYGAAAYGAMALSAVAGCACAAIAHHARQRAMA
ncbi:MAG TPA: MFS transporter [Pseudolabrys sp.]|nr:MFS transporter [Pseudolabrys sp.]